MLFIYLFAGDRFACLLLVWFRFLLAGETVAYSEESLT